MRKDGVGRLPSDKVMSTCQFIAHTVEEAAITPPDDPHVVASHFNVCSEGHNTTISMLLFIIDHVWACPVAPSRGMRGGREGEGSDDDSMFFNFSQPKIIHSNY
jgi:hypothetical protein